MSLCFISYARQNNKDGRLAKFVEKLRVQLLQYLPHGTKEEEVAFFDATDIQTGDQWMERLAEATRLSRICICFWSTPYFTSEYSGREVQVFLQRLQQWQQQVGNAGKQAHVIVPVLWIKAKPPVVLQAFQYSDAGWPKRYLEEGLLALALSNNRRSDYNAVVNELAKRIAATLAGVTLPDGSPIQHFGHIASAFHTASTPTRYGIAAILLAEPTVVAKPFAADTASVESLLEQVSVACNAPMRRLTITNAIAADLAAAVAARELPLLVAHQPSLESPTNAPLVALLTAGLDANSTVVVFNDPLPDVAVAAASLEASTAARFAGLQGQLGATGLIRVMDATAMKAALSVRLTTVRNDLIQADPPARAESPALTASAKSEGIALAAKPLLSTGSGS